MIIIGPQKLIRRDHLSDKFTVVDPLILMVVVKDFVQVSTINERGCDPHISLPSPKGLPA